MREGAREGAGLSARPGAMRPERQRLRINPAQIGVRASIVLCDLSAVSLKVGEE